MKIEKIRMRNFRGFLGEKNIDFEGTPFVLLSAPNGSGKTSVIDAIEWCLTGNIGRLKEAYDNRSTNNTERKKNWDGILKNKKADKNDYVEVELTYIDNNESFCLLRKQKSDELNKEKSEVFLNGSNIYAENELKKLVDKNFYNYHFCDVRKSFAIQSKQRKDLPELFTEFITDYSKETAIAHNLEVFAEDVDRYKSDLEKEKIDNFQIINLEKLLEKYAEAPEVVPYPQEILYEGEEIDISQMDEETLNGQLQQLYSCGYFVSNIYLDKIRSDIYYRDAISKLENLKKLLEKNKDEIEDAIKYYLHKDNSKIEAITDKIRKYEALNLDKKNIRENSNLLLSFQSKTFTKDFYDKTINEINCKEQRLNELEKEIEHMTKGNTILSSFTILLSQKEGILEYQKESKKCPVCASTLFGELSDSQILSEAEEYISSNNRLVANKTDDKIETEKIIRTLYGTLITTANEALNHEIVLQKNLKLQLEEIKEKTKHYFSLANQLALAIGKECDREKLGSMDYIQNKICTLREHLLTEDEIEINRKNYQDILNLIGYNFTGEETATGARIKELAKDCPHITNYSYSLLAQKINAVNSVKNNKEYLDCTKKLNQYRKYNTEITLKQKEYDSLYDKAKKRAEKIKQLVEELKREEYDSVGPELKRYYKKLARINSLTSINIVFEENQISIIDENGKNLVNILSNGQLGIFMLAYFFAGIAKRSKKENFKIYFIDDLTACMDDINMLSFLDLLKYQMADKNGTMEQIFFSTCDDRICRLLKYKLNGCRVEYCEIGEKELMYQIETI